jgi:cell division transport system permease protein
VNVGLAELSKTYATTFRLGFLSPWDAITITVFSALVGWLGAYWSVSKHLREINVV